MFFPEKVFNSQLNHAVQNHKTATTVTKRKTTSRQPTKNNQLEPCTKTQKLQYKQLMDILESISDNVLSVDYNWNITYTSKRQASIFGYKASEMIGKNFWQLLPNLIGTEIEKNFRAAMEKREKKCYEITGIFKSGYYEQSIFPSANGITIYTKDITERKKAEQGLRQSEERFARLFHSSPAALFISRLNDGLLIDVNDSFLKILEYEYTEVIGHTVFELNIYFDPNKRKKLVDFLKINRSVRNYEVIIRTKTGKCLTVIMSSETIVLNEHYFLLGTFIDITERKKAEEALKISEERLRSAQKIAHVGNWEYYLKENKAIWSEELFNVFKIEPKQYGPPLEEYSKLIHPDDIDTMNKIMIELLSKGHLGDEVSLDYRILTGDGSVRVLHSQRMIGAVDKEGKPSKVIGIEQDITERKKIEQQLEQYSKDLEKLVEERTKQLKDAEHLATIGQVAGMVGHDIRNPLQAIFSELYFAKKAVLESPQTKDKQNALESLGIIQEQADYISKIVSDLQDYAKTLKPEIKEVDLNELINSTFLAINVPERITLSIKIEPSLKLNTDPTFIRRAITNLSNNAIQAMSKKGELSITVTKIDKQIRITVKDTGEGIPEEVRGRLFTPLFTTKSKGQGFGLAVTRRLIEALSGTISFESRVGKGTIFQIELPV